MFEPNYSVDETYQQTATDARENNRQYFGWSVRKQLGKVVKVHIVSFVLFSCVIKT
jgi:hypothetical protein